MGPGSPDVSATEDSGRYWGQMEWLGGPEGISLVDLIGWDLLVCLGGETVTLKLWGLSD